MAEEKEKELYQITDRWNDKAIPVDWDILPEELIDEIPDCLYNVMAFSPEEGVNIKTVVYFRKVKKFKKGITEHIIGNIIYGV